MSTQVQSASADRVQTLRAAAAAAARAARGHFIDGEWADPTGEGTTAVTNPATEAVIAEVANGSARDISRAVAAARRAFPDWSTTGLEIRVDAVERVGAAMAARRQELAEVVTAELGMPLHLAAEIQVDSPTRAFRTIGAYAERTAWTQRAGTATVIKEPYGVVGAITPWNFPLDQIAVKIAPALVSGCTVVLKPSEVTPLSALLLAEIIEGVGLPAGVFNLVTGTGPVVGEALAGHAGLDKLSFTGSTRAGRRVSVLAGENVTPVTLELGGKSANVVLEDAPLEAAVASGVDSCYFNAGQTCNALTRMLVPVERLGEAEELIVAAAERHRVGDPLDPSATIGPLVSESQRERVRGYMTAGEREGAQLLCGGVEPPDGFSHGYYVRPTVFSRVGGEMRIAQEEIFGPVLSVIPYGTEEEAIQVANGTPYGLAASVWAGDDERARAVMRRLRAGQVQLNGGQDDPSAPFGGFKRSGHGRENGAWGIEEFLAPKAVLG
jgi:acyl-CoA reductase-like NAD-dependent aldehyde dehydrogenase